MDRSPAKLRELLASGAVRLVLGAAVLRWAAEGRAVLPRQGVSEEDFADPGEFPWELTPDSFAAGFSQPGEGGDCSKVRLVVVSISYSWLSRAHPDPGKYHLARIANVVAAAQLNYKNALVVVFWDYASLEQKRPLDSLASEVLDGLTSAPKPWKREKARWGERDVVVDSDGWRYAEEHDRFGQALSEMEIWYGHPKTITVKLTDVPEEEPRKYSDRGWTTFESCVSDCKEGLVCDMRGLTVDEAVGEVAAGMFSNIGGRYSGQRGLPMTPEEFTNMLASKSFTNQSDHGTVGQLYEKTFEAMARTAQMLMLTRCGLTDHDALRVVALISRYQALEIIKLDNNDFGDRGACALARSFAGAEHLERVNLTNNRIGLVGYLALLWGKGRRGGLLIECGECLSFLACCLGLPGMMGQRSAFGLASWLILWPLWLLLWVLRLALCLPVCPCRRLCDAGPRPRQVTPMATPATQLGAPAPQ